LQLENNLDIGHGSATIFTKEPKEPASSSSTYDRARSHKMLMPFYFSYSFIGVAQAKL